MKKDIKREDIKYNFLKQICIRFDYSGVDDSELESLVIPIGDYLNKNGYISKERYIENELNIDIKDPEKIEVEGLIAKNIRKQIVYVFRHMDPQVQLKIGSSFAVISIDKTRYVNCLDYCRILIEVMRLVEKNTIYFRCIRFGLRKINQCYFYDISKLNDYFEPSHFNLYTFKGRSSCKVMTNTDSIYFDNYNLNISREIMKGELDGREAYQIRLDSDIYLRDNDAKNVIDDNAFVVEMNMILFEIYKDALRDGFLRKLVDGSICSDEQIEGVVSNE